MRLQVRLPNGVTLDLGEAGLNEVSPIMQMLSHLPCSN
jgi:transposase